MNVIFVDRKDFEYSTSVLIAGAGACGLTAALAASDAGAEVLVIERDKTPRGSTGLSTGLIPASRTKAQAKAGVVDNDDDFRADIMAKTKGKTDAALVDQMVAKSAEVVDWLCDAHALELELCVGLRYPGHRCDRMHGTKNRTGAELEDQLLVAAERKQIDIMTSAEAQDLFVTPDRRIVGVRVRRPDGSFEELGCRAFIAATCGFAANKEMIDRYIPSLRGAQYLGHEGNTGHAVEWGLRMGAALADMGSFQGHGAIGDPSGVPMWNTITINGIQINLEGRRFSNEASGYSEQALRVVAQPQSLAWNIFDYRGHQLASTYIDYREGLTMGAVKIAPTIEELSAVTNLPLDALRDTLSEVRDIVAGKRKCPFGRDFTGVPPIEPPYYAGRITGAYLHTQGGLVVTPEDGRVVDLEGKRFPNFFAGGGAARGISGDGDSGYLAGNGLLTAVVLGALAGRAAAELTKA